MIGVAYCAADRCPVGADRSGTWDQVLAALLTSADAAEIVNWDASVDSTVIRAYQHAANLARDAGGKIELQESAG